MNDLFLFAKNLALGDCSDDNTQATKQHKLTFLHINVGLVVITWPSNLKQNDLRALGTKRS